MDDGGDDGAAPGWARSNVEEGSFDDRPILSLSGWCSGCAGEIVVHLGLTLPLCRCGNTLVEITDDGRRWRRAGGARQLAAILGRLPEDAPRDGSKIVAWFAGERHVADSKWDGTGWRMRFSDGWRRVDAPLIGWLPTTLEAEVRDLD